MPVRRWFAKKIEWLGGHELSVLLGGLAVAAGFWIFLLFGRLVTSGRTLALDDRILLACRTPGDLARPVGPVWVADVARDITALGSTDLLWLATVAVAGFLGLDRRYRAMVFVLAAVLGGWAISFLLKDLFQRSRPSVVPHLMPAYFSSFPSGHSLMSAVVYLTLGSLLSSLVKRRRLKFYFLALAALLSGLVGLSRVILGVHYPTDVVAGWFAGLVWATLCWTIERGLARHGTIEATV